MKKLKITVETLKKLTESENNTVKGGGQTTTGVDGPKSVWG